MITKEFLIILKRMNELLPENTYWIYGNSEIVEISTDIEAKIELKNGVLINVKDIIIEKLRLSED